MSPITGYVSGCLGSVFGATFDAATNAWVAAVVANGGTVSAARKTLVDNLITGLKSDGVWTKLDRLFILAAENTPSALTDMVADALGTNVNSTTFTVDRGYTGNGSNMYIDTNFDPTVGTPHFVQDSAHVSAYVEQIIGSSASQEVLTGTFATRIITVTGSSILNYFVNDSVSGNVTGLVAAMYLATRPSSAASLLYKNGSLVDTHTNASSSFGSGTFQILARGATDNSQAQIAGFSVGGGLSATDVSNLSTRINTYMTAIGANVY